MTIDTEAGKVFPSLAQVEKFLMVAENFCTMDAPPVPHGRLRMCSLIGRVIARVSESSRLAMTLVAPLWPEKEWFADLLLLLTQPPLALPWWDSLLRQPHCNFFVHALNLHVRRLSSVTSESRAFREGLLEPS